MTFEEANKKAMDYFGGDELAAQVFLKKYARTDGVNYLESNMDDLRDRLSREISDVETRLSGRTHDSHDFRDLLNRFLPAGRICYGLGNDLMKNSTLSNCFVIPSPKDNLESIFETAAQQARIFSRGGGVGLDVSNLRPVNAKVNNVALTSTGAVSFMDLYSMVTGLISQNSRRGALMLTMDCHHPDLIEFIKVKGGNDKTKVQFANVSVKITNDFMRAVETDGDWTMTFVTEHGDEIVRTEKAKDIWDLLVESNWNGAEPGILFWDAITQSPTSVFEVSKPISTNPCGEQPLPGYGSCNLGSMVLSKYVEAPFTSNARFNIEQFRNDVKLAVRFMSNVNLINKDRQPLPENREIIEQTNAIGLGFTALADTFIMMNLKYDTEEAIEFAGTMARELKESTVIGSVELAKERGSFKLLSTASEEDRKSYMTHPFFKFLERPGLETSLLDFHTYGTHNIQFNTVAPNGSISIILQTSSGLEPIFCTEYERTVMTGDVDKPKKFVVYHPLVKIYESATGNSYKDNPNFVTAEQIDWKMRVKMQSAIQESISESISSTVNLPNDVTKETISGIYFEAWKSGLKGITIYRAGCREGVLNKTETKQELPVCEHVKFPDSTDAKMRVIRSEGKKWYVTYTLDHETKLPNSLFVNTNATETNITTTGVLDSLRELAREHVLPRFIDELNDKITHQTNVVKTARFLSLLLRHRVPILDIIKAIEIVGIPMNSFAYRIKGLLAEFVEGKISGDDCPECKSKMIYQNGCKMCQNCGYSKCG